MAAQQEYNITIPKQSFAMCSGVSMGFGVGGMCSVLIAGVMVFGLLYDKGTTKRLRLKLLSEFKQKFGNLNCSVLRKEHNECEDLISEIAELIDRLIKEEDGVSYRKRA